jgi:hypothetical protein
MLIDPGSLTDIAGLGLLVMGMVYQWRKKEAVQVAARGV